MRYKQTFKRKVISQAGRNSMQISSKSYNFERKRFAGTVQLGDLVCHVFLEYDENVQYLIV